MRIVTKSDTGQWLKATNEYERIMATATTKAMRDVGKEGVEKGRASIAAGGFSSKFQRTLRAINKPPSGYVLNPSVYIHSTINYADVFETGKTITGNPLLWLPLPSVPPGKNRKHMTPREYIRNVGRLVTITTRKHGGLIMLGAIVEGPPTKKKVSRRRLESTALRRAFGAKVAPTHVVPMFIGIARITIPKKFDVHGAVKDAFQNLDEFYAKHLEPYEGRR